MRRDRESLHLHNQVEGAVVQAIGGALFEQIQFRMGRFSTGGFRALSIAAV